MGIFNPQKIDTSLINRNQRYQNGDIPDAEAINAPIEASAWAQQVAQEAKILAEAASGIETEAFFEAIRGIVSPLHKLSIFTDNTNPAEVYGGYWLKVKDAFLWCSGDVESITYTKNGQTVTESLLAGSTGGEYSHKLTVEEMPNHNHELTQSLLWSDGTAAITQTGTATGVPNTTERLFPKAQGSNQDHNNMPPYHAVNAWVRVTEEEFNENESL